MYWGKHFYSIYSSTFGLQGIVVPLVGFASFSDSCSAAPQAMLSKKERRASEWVSDIEYSTVNSSEAIIWQIQEMWTLFRQRACKGMMPCGQHQPHGVRVRFSARAGRPSSARKAQLVAVSLSPAGWPSGGGSAPENGRAAPPSSLQGGDSFFSRPSKILECRGQEVQNTRLPTENKK